MGFIEPRTLQETPRRELRPLEMRHNLSVAGVSETWTWACLKLGLLTLSKATSQMVSEGFYEAGLGIVEKIVKTMQISWGRMKNHC